LALRIETAANLEQQAWIVDAFGVPRFLLDLRTCSTAYLWNMHGAWRNPMMNRVLIVSVALFGAHLASAQEHDHANCPMAGSMSHRSEVDHRHDQATGVSHEGSAHHFLLAPDGGTIRLEATSADKDARDAIRQHLQVVARAFAAGDFALPMLIHDQVPPGVDVMKAMKAVVRYEYAPRDNGGDVRISTSDPAALAAVHAFLRFQIDDHGTGDPKE
jgi:hypothetical protein